MDTPKTPDTILTEYIKVRMPGIQTQAQFDAVKLCFEVFDAVVADVCKGSFAGITEGEKAFRNGLLALQTASTLTSRIREVPEAVTSEAAEAFKREPSQFQEAALYNTLMEELDKITTVLELSRWYEYKRYEIDLIKSPSLRDPLFDKIRNKKVSLG